MSWVFCALALGKKAEDEALGLHGERSLAEWVTDTAVRKSKDMNLRVGMDCFALDMKERKGKRKDDDWIIVECRARLETVDPVSYYPVCFLCAVGPTRPDPI